MVVRTDGQVLQQVLLFSVGFLPGFLEVQIGLMIGMFGALLAREQSVNREQLHA
jgi:hypothetical protein